MQSDKEKLKQTSCICCAGFSSKKRKKKNSSPQQKNEIIESQNHSQYTSEEKNIDSYLKQKNYDKRKTVIEEEFLIKEPQTEISNESFKKLSSIGDSFEGYEIKVQNFTSMEQSGSPEHFLLSSTFINQEESVKFDSIHLC